MENIYQFLIDYITIIETVALIVMGGIIAYYKSTAKLKGVVAELIAEAEQAFDSTKSGGKRFAWVVNKLYELIPAPLKAIINKQMIEQIVQGTFDSMAAYAKTQLDRAVDKAIPDKEG